MEESEVEDEEGNLRPKKRLVVYEHDLGVNNVTRKETRDLHAGANLLLGVPGGQDGPGGVLVLGENCVQYASESGDVLLTAPLPRRYTTADQKGVLLVACASMVNKKVSVFLAQSEYGDLYRIHLGTERDDAEEGWRVNDLRVQYFDSIPVCSSFVLLRTGHLFASSEFGNHYMFEFKGLGDDDDTACAGKDTDLADFVYFQPRTLTNLALLDEQESLSPVTELLVRDLVGEQAPQIYALCGRGPRSALRVLRQGLAVAEIACSELPGTPTNVWAVKKHVLDL